MSKENQRDDALFEALGQSRKKRRRKILLAVGAIILVAAIILVSVVSTLQQRVRTRFSSSDQEILSYEVTTGTIHTTVSGSGTLEAVDLEQLTVPAGVEITEVLAERRDMVSTGDMLATVDMSTVMQALAEAQATIDDLDDQIADAEADKVSSTIKAGVSGRVKQLYAEKGTDVTACMAENGALAVLSLDDYMAVDIETDALTKGDSVTVIRTDGTEITGTVEKVAAGIATVLVTDNGPECDEEVTVAFDGGEVSGKLYIHKPLKVTGYAGTVSAVNYKENSKVYANSALFTLTGTSFSANYDTLLREREEKEELLLELLKIYQDGAILAPFDGQISSVDYDETTVTAYTETAVVSLAPNESMQVTISVDESDILSLAVGQEVEVTVASVGEDIYTGTVTEVNQTATTSSGITVYSAVVTIPMADGMLPGMTAEVDIEIEGVDNAILVPVDALHQTSAITYVYTAYDEKTEEYGGMTEVTTGLWGSNYVEITSGLNVGDVVYYTEEQTFIFPGFGNMNGMGGMSSGGSFEMPSGDFEMPDRGGSRGNMSGQIPGGFGGN